MMKYFIFLGGFLLVTLHGSDAQDFYSMSGGEMIFSGSQVTVAGDDINTTLRFTTAMHFGEYIHADFGDNIGFFTGLGLRNVGLITDENDVRIKYRSYNLGVPVAFKIGSFSKNLYVFGGAEYEWRFHFKQKTFREGVKHKHSSWFSSRTSAFIPSAFAGFQFPGGVQVKFRYYLDDFLNHHFNAGDFHNYTIFTKTQVWYISLSYIIRNKKKDEIDAVPTEVARL